jgi:serine/threonine protein kinase
MAAPEISDQVQAVASTSERAFADCLSDEEVLAFASGTLASARHLAAHYHLDQCEVCQRLLSEAAHALGPAATAPFNEGEELSWHTTFQLGTLVGQRYLIVRFIARGGMGEVYEAFDRELQERVALKTVTSTACDNASAVRRLKAEVQLARRVSHPNVCRIYDFGTHIIPEAGAQISFLTMEFVDGETLGQRIRSGGALTIDGARALGRQLLSGLSAAHEAGVLHRDFKSDNVMLRDEPGAGRSPLILDFGLARALDEGSRNNSSSHPNLLGTFGYIAPEQLQGRPHTTASDVYSFGIVWFQMLTGELPFDSCSSPVRAALARVQASAVPPSSKNPKVSSDLDAVVLGCLRRSPKDRFRTAREVLDALDAAEARAQRSFQKRKLLPLAIATVLGGLAAYAAAVPANHQLVANAARPLALPSQREPPISKAESIPSAARRDPRVEPTPSAERPRKPALAQPNRAGALQKAIRAPASDAAASADTNVAPGSLPAPPLEVERTQAPPREGPFDAGPSSASPPTAVRDTTLVQ